MDDLTKPHAIDLWIIFLWPIIYFLFFLLILVIRFKVYPLSSDANTIAPMFLLSLCHWLFFRKLNKSKIDLREAGGAFKKKYNIFFMPAEYLALIPLILGCIILFKTFV